MVNGPSRPAITIVLALSVAVAGCAGAGGSPSVAPATPTPAASVPPEPTVIEDAGIEVELAAGTYTSRLFKPPLTLELGPGWYRRDANTERVLNLRRSSDLAGDVTFISAPDFIQCGTGDVVAKPEASQIADLLVGSDQLDVTEPAEVPVGAGTGTAVRLLGTGEPPTDGAFSPEFGCVISLGDAPFPAESGWVGLMRDARLQLILVDVGGTTVLIRFRPGSDPDGFFESGIDAAKGFHLG